MLKGPCDDLISVYFDSKDNVLIFGSVKKGARIDCGIPYELKSPYSAEDLGRKVLLMLEQVTSLTIGDIDVVVPMYTKATGIKSWKRFAKERRLVAINWYREHGFLLYRMVLSAQYAYTPVCDNESPIQLPKKVNSKDFGEALLLLCKKQ